MIGARGEVCTVSGFRAPRRRPLESVVGDRAIHARLPGPDHADFFSGSRSGRGAGWMEKSWPEVTGIALHLARISGARHTSARGAIAYSGGQAKHDSGAAGCAAGRG